MICLAAGFCLPLGLPVYLPPTPFVYLPPSLPVCPFGLALFSSWTGYLRLLAVLLGLAEGRALGLTVTWTLSSALVVAVAVAVALPE